MSTICYVNIFGKVAITASICYIEKSTNFGFIEIGDINGLRHERVKGLRLSAFSVIASRASFDLVTYINRKDVYCNY